MGIGGGAHQGETSPAGAEQLAAPCPSLPRPVVEGVDVVIRGPGRRASLQLPATVEKPSDCLHIAFEELLAHLVDEVADLEESLVLALLDGVPLASEDLIAALPRATRIEEEQAAVKR